MSAYYELLKRPEWQKKRFEMLSISEWRCEVCLSQEDTLHVHHKRYFKGRKPWEYENSELEVLCDNCHSQTHANDNILNELFSLFSFSQREEVVALVLAYIHSKGSGKYGQPEAKESLYELGMAIDADIFTVASENLFNAKNMEKIKELNR